MIRTLLVDDHPVVRTGLRAVLDGQGEVEIVGEAATGAEAVALAKHLLPDVVLCDLRLEGEFDGIATTARLRALDQPPAVLILTTFDRDAEILAAIEAGAAGYLLKDVEPSVIVRSIQAAARGETVLSPELASRVFHGMRNPKPQLTAREHDVMVLLAQGLANREIARQLHIGEATVKSHLVHVFAKLEVDSRSRAIHQAREWGLV